MTFDVIRTFAGRCRQYITGSRDKEVQQSPGAGLSSTALVNVIVTKYHLGTRKNRGNAASSISKSCPKCNFLVHNSALD